MAESEKQFEPKALRPPPHGKNGFIRRKFRKFNVLLVIGIIIVGILLYRAEKQRNEVTSQLAKTNAELEELEKTRDAAAAATTQSNDQDMAREVLAKLRNHILIPDFPKPTVATIVDVETLKKANSFYEPAANGDYLIITEQRAILYDSDRDLILDIVPVQANQDASTTETTPAPSGITPEATSPLPWTRADPQNYSIFHFTWAPTSAPQCFLAPWT